jgi:hypothetical protein
MKKMLLFTLLEEKNHLLSFIITCEMEDNSIHAPLLKKVPFRVNHFLILFTIIMGIGIVVRTWKYNQIPAGLHQDEASLGLDAFDILHFGMDRHGISYPLQFITWGDGEMVLYSYIAIPFIALFGLTQYAIRLPNLIAGILLVPLVYMIGKKILGTRFGLVSMFMIAISPWNIIGSRYGINPYLYVFIFSLSFYLLLCSEFRSSWILPAVIGFALCCYTYSAAFVIVPVFLLISSWIYRRNIRDNWQINLFAGLLILTLVIPILIFLVINTFNLESVSIGRFTIPKLIDQPRFLSQTGVNQSGMLANYFQNTLVMLSILFSGSDHWLRNGIEPYGYTYPFAFLLALIGICLILLKKVTNYRSQKNLLIAWFIAALPVGIIQSSLIWRICLIFIPITFLLAITLTEIWNWKRTVFIGVICSYLVGFAGFTVAYFSPAYSQNIARDFNVGLLESIQHTKTKPESTVCFSKSITGAYVYILYLEKPDPRSYLTRLGDHVNGANPFPTGHPLYRFRFREDRCPSDTPTIHILRVTDPIPENVLDLKRTQFGQFLVLEP